MLTSCQFMADGAVRRPSGRLMPKAAQSKFESVCGGSWAGLSACAAETTDRQMVASTSVSTNGALCFIREFLPMLSAKILGFFGCSYCRPVCCRTL